jgi:hypothetical protein
VAFQFSFYIIYADITYLLLPHLFNEDKKFPASPQKIFLTAKSPWSLLSATFIVW